MTELLNYKAYEQAVYHWLMSKHEADPTFTFSLRQKEAKGAESDYFIGTEKSNYFSTSFWYLPVAFPGSSGDCLGLFFMYTKTGYNYFFEFNQTKSPHDDQNKAALLLVQKLQKALQDVVGFQKQPTAKNKMFSLKTKVSKGSYDTLEEMFLEIEKDIAIILPVVDETINEVKKQYPNFKVHRWTLEEFEEMNRKLEERIERNQIVLDKDSNFEQFQQAIEANSSDDLKTYFDFLKVTLDKLKLIQGDDRLQFNCRNKTLRFTIGQRYCFYLIPKNRKGKFGVLSKDPLNSNSELFNGKIKVPYFTHFDVFKPIESEIQNIQNGFENELKRSTKSGYRIHNNEFFESAVFNHIIGNPIKMDNMKATPKIISKNEPLNQILYGPPGTGKTYRLKSEYFPKYTLNENSISPETYFEDVVGSLTWWQVIALALIEIGTNRVNEILENRWVSKKAQLSESKNVRATIWGTLQMHTIADSKTVNYTQRQTPFIFDKTDDKKWKIFESDLKEQAPEVYEILDSVNNFKPNPNKEIKHYVFTTFHQSFSYEDFIEGIKPIMEEGNEVLQYKIENGIFKDLCIKAQNDPNHRYAIFIDEINRGNISQIFGELITLIETDKRIGAENELRVKLPYSKKEFGVPLNVDIYGTMNTADRSVEALDTALRRRFTFKEMMPNFEIVKSKNFTDFDRVGIMNKINQRIEVLLDRNYTLGHSYFIKPDFKNSFENEIIPLLQEYFYNDYGKIGLVLGKGFVREKAITVKNDKSVFADFDTKHEVEINKSYELIPFAEINFDEAIQILLT